MPTLIFNITSSATSHTCLSSFVCANETFISIYGVIFTIVISLGVYIYGLQDKSEKITLTKNTNIKGVITSCLSLFALCFIALPSPLYEVVNFAFVGGLIFNLFSAFREVFKFNENELSGERAVKKFKEGVITEKLMQFEDLKARNDSLNKVLEEKRESKQVERFLFDETDEAYTLIRAQNSGYITNVDLSVLFTQEINQASSKKLFYYIPYGISNGAPIEFDSVILGVRKEDWQGKDEEKLRSFISISDEYENPFSYLEAEVRSYYSEMFGLIKMEDSKGLELKLKEFSSFLDHFTNKADSYVDIIQFINDDIIFPLQKYAFKLGDTDCIRKIVSFSLGYIYQSLDKKSIQTFNIFLRNFGHAFYESLELETGTRSEFHDTYFRWLNEAAKYSIKPKFQKDDDYIEYALTFLSNLNGWLKIAFDNKDIGLFEKTLAFLNSSFSREDYEHDDNHSLDKVIINKKAVIFGFTAWVYRYYGGRRDEEFYKNALTALLTALQKDPAYYPNIQDDLNYYLSVYLKTVQLSESRGSYGWDSWGMPEGSVYTITIRDDIKKLLTDRILKTIIDNSELNTDIKDGNYNDELSRIKEGNQQFDPLFSKTKDSFLATLKLTDEAFSTVKVTFYKIFAQVTEKYDADVKKKLIEQPLDEAKFQKFALENFKSYENARVLHRIRKFNKESEKRKEGFGYNILLNKEQFVSETNVHYTNNEQFGEDLARSEDNRILKTIYEKFSELSSLEKNAIGQLVRDETGLSAVVLWVNGYFNIEDTNADGFRPYWQDADSRKERGPYYQGSINGVPIYIVYKFQEHKDYPDTIFFFKEAAFSIAEFELEREASSNEENTKWTESLPDCLVLSIEDLSSSEDLREKIVETWIKNDPTSVVDKEAKIDELKLNVVFKFYKGLSPDNLQIEDARVKVFLLMDS